MKTTHAQHSVIQKGLLPVFCICLACLVTCCSLFSACTSFFGLEDPEPEYISPYNWEDLVQENGRFTYSVDGKPSSHFGVDVSEHQGVINWQAVADDGVEFALIRIGNRGATEGQLYVDKYFEANLAGAKEAGILTGVYFFSQAINEEEAQEEAQFVLKHLANKTLDYPIAFDHEPVATATEGRANRLSGKQVSLCAEAFCQTIEAAGYETMLYGNRTDILRLDETLLSSHDIWVADYDVPRPTIKHDFTIWQFTSHGTVAGINTRCDLNIHFLLPEPLVTEEARTAQ